MSALLKVQDLRVNYGKVEAIHNISLEVGAGQIVTVIGPNGAGKTTSLAAIMGLLPSSGHIDFDGHVQRAANVEKRVIQGLALVPEKPQNEPPTSVAKTPVIILRVEALFRRSRHARRVLRLSSSVPSGTSMFDISVIGTEAPAPSTCSTHSLLIPLPRNSLETIRLTLPRRSHQLEACPLIGRTIPQASFHSSIPQWPCISRQPNRGSRLF